MKATRTEWLSYIEDRRAKGFTIVQIGLAPSWAGSKNADERAAFLGSDWCDFSLSPTSSPLPTPDVCRLPDTLADDNPETRSFWENYDELVKIANDHGLYVLIAGLIEPLDDGPNQPRYLPVPVAKDFARWIALRLNGDYVIFSPGFDSRLQASLMDAVGHEIKRVSPRTLVTNHWSANTPTSEVAFLQYEPWLDFQMFQSGHRDGVLNEVTQRARDEAWKISGASGACFPDSGSFQYERKAAVNGEAIYDQGNLEEPNLAIPTPDFSRYRARQAAYLSLFSGAFGYSLGVGGIWDWGLCVVPGNEACEFKINGQVRPYTTPAGWQNYGEAMVQLSSTQIQHFGDFMRSVLPGPGTSNGGWGFIDAQEQHRIQDQDPCHPADPSTAMVVARNWDYLAAYLPDNGEISLDLAGLDQDPHFGHWLRPQDGSTRDLPVDVPCTGQVCTFSHPVLSTPDDKDWLLVLDRHGKAPHRWSSKSTAARFFTSSGRRNGASTWQILGRLEDPATRGDSTSFEISDAPTCLSRVNLPSSARVTADGRGQFLVVWQADADCDLRWEVWGRFVSSHGGMLTPSLRLSPVDGRDHYQPSVAMDSTGRARAVWLVRDGQQSNGEIWSAQLTLAGASTAAPLVAARATVLSQPTIECDAEGRFTLAWVESEFPTLQSVVWSQRLTDKGDVNGVPSAASSTSAPIYWLTGVTADADGEIAITWEARDPDRSHGLYQRSYDANGAPIGSEVLVSPPLQQ